MKDLHTMCLVVLLMASCSSFPDRDFASNDGSQEDVSEVDVGSADTLPDGATEDASLADLPDTGERDVEQEADADACARNFCGGCEPLPEGFQDGVPCGTCDSGVWACDTPDTVFCRGDAGDAALNSCGGCQELEWAPEEPCGFCPLRVGRCDPGGGSSCIFPLVPAMGDPVLPGRYFVTPEAILTLGYSLAMSRTEVTQRQWSRLGFDLPTQLANCGDCPVTNISFLSMVAFANAASITQDLPTCYLAQGDPYNIDHARAAIIPEWPDRFACEGYRIPSEMEWIVAASQGVEPGGEFEGDISDYAWWSGNAEQMLQVVGCRQPTVLGLYDILGNADETVYDAYFSRLPDGELEDYVYEQGVLGTVARGGDVIGTQREVSLSYRVSVRELNTQYLGFRLVRTLREE